jgi:hypothetical protein
VTCADAAQPLKLNFSDETVGAEPKSFVSVVGVWRIENEGNNKVLVVDGRQWKQGQTAAGIADKARALYGDRYAEFLDRVQAYAYFPYVVANDVTDFRNGEISRALRRHFRPHRSGRRNLVQSQAERRLSHRPRQSTRKQSRAVDCLMTDFKPRTSSHPRAARADLIGIADKLEPRSGAAAVVTVEQFLIRGLGTACQSVRRGAASRRRQLTTQKLDSVPAFRRECRKDLPRTAS